MKCDINNVEKFEDSSTREKFPVKKGPKKVRHDKKKERHDKRTTKDLDCVLSEEDED